MKINILVLTVAAEKLVHKSNIFMSIFRFSKHRIVWYCVWNCFEEHTEERIVQTSSQNKRVSSSCILFGFLLLAYRFKDECSLLFAKYVSYILLKIVSYKIRCLIQKYNAINMCNVMNPVLNELNEVTSYPKLLVIRYDASYENTILLIVAMSWTLSSMNLMAS